MNRSGRMERWEGTRMRRRRGALVRIRYVREKSVFNERKKFNLLKPAVLISHGLPCEYFHKKNQPHEQKTLEVIFYFSFLSHSFHFLLAALLYGSFHHELEENIGSKDSNLFLFPVLKGIILSLSTCDIC